MNLERKLSQAYSYLGGIPGRELAKALKSDEGLSVSYQPQVSAADSHVIAVEALVRWSHPSVGPVSPRVFIPLAEETGLITQITDFVLKDACALSRRHPDLKVAVNLSPMQFNCPVLIERLTWIVNECGANPSQIEFEITENLPLGGNGSARETIASLRDAGFRIALDDYGVGYSGLKRLNHIGVDKLKIDQSFIRDLAHATSMQPYKTIEEMIDLGRRMNLTVTAEGVETEAQRDFLSWAGCDILQGYLFARPMPVQELEAFLSRQPCDAVAA
ncbi:EAL domain-containing protein [Microvirga sp. BT688]|uniref:EAL domain-containing protein n=1 Tax=Microvirga sp. TaxID=1873136 RepID=UPI0016820E66|nr:EAL domain-containing protein [Microvirga sp.]MBD2745922.1 EAL domain-containing protein [Microvirga sp.]